MKSGRLHIFPLILAGLLILPWVIKSVHDFEHRYEPSCQSNHEKHFHESHHDCWICEFNLISKTKYVSNNIQIAFDFFLPAPGFSAEFSQAFGFRSLVPGRAPPFV